MIDFAEVKAAVQARLNAAWTQTPIAYENDLFTPPSDSSGNPQPYMRIYIQERASQAPVNWTAPQTAAQRLAGTIYVVGYVPEGQGDAALEQLVSAAKAIFEGQTFYTASYRVFVQKAVGALAGTEAPWFKKLVSLPFWADWKLP